MKAVLLRLLTAILFCVASSLVIGFVIGMALWVTIGDTHDEIWAASRPIILTLAFLLTCVFLVLDLTNRTSNRSIAVRLCASVLVCLLAVGVRIHTEVSRFEGWNSEDAALAVASRLYPELTSSMVLREDSRSDLSAFGRGPNIHFTVMSGTEPICRLAVCRQYWAWWTCGMYETLKERKAQDAPASNGIQPIRSQTNSPSSAAGSRR